ncbi:MAG: Rieske 2Fe-2S domain-containing protein [Gaiellaceae bacterium]
MDAGVIVAGGVVSLPPYPTGWYAIGLGSELAHATVISHPFMGEDLVVYRTRSGIVRAVDPYCPHLGAHLGHGGWVDDERIVCPFHSFAYDVDGACVRTGYGTKPPAQARLAHRPVRELNGLLLVWHGEGSPSWDVPELDLDGWTPVRCRRFVLRDHPQETTENSVDLGHFAIVHGYRNVRMLREAVADGPYLNTAYFAEQPLPSPLPWRTVAFEFETHIFGLGYSLVDVRVRRPGLEARLWVLPTPIDERRLTLRLAASVRGRAGWLAGHTDRILTQLVLWGFAHGAKADFPIWEHKQYRERPALALGDGPIGLYRRWARQFYEDAVAEEPATRGEALVSSP